MTNKLEIFRNEEFGEIRTVIIDREPWFVLKDVCEVLGISKYRDAAERLEEVEGRLVRVDTPGGEQEMTAANESGLYSIILRSDKPNTKQFKRWITHEVLPLIRKTGSYQLIPKTFSEALRAYANEVEQKELALKQRDEAIQTKAWIGNKREASAMATASIKSRECEKFKVETEKFKTKSENFKIETEKFKTESEKLKIEIGKSKQYASIKSIEIKTKRKFDWHKLRNYCTSHELEVRKVFDANYGKVNSYPTIAWKNVYGIDLLRLYSS